MVELNLDHIYKKYPNASHYAVEDFNLDIKDKPFDVVTSIKPKKIASLKSDYDLITARLNSAVHNCNSREDYNKFLEMFYLATRRLMSEKFNA